MKHYRIRFALAFLLSVLLPANYLVAKASDISSEQPILLKTIEFTV